MEFLLKGWLNTVDLLVLTSLDKLLLILKINFFLFYKTSYLNKKVNHAEPSPSVRVSWVKVRSSSLSHIQRGSML
jgi:hypothetical protein